MILTAFTAFHVLLSLIGIGAGFVFVYGLLTSKQMEKWTAVFLWSTVLTSVTGFLFPAHHFTPGHAVGILSLIALTIAIRALGSYRRTGAWRKTFVISSMVALYFNFFVLIVQSFEKVPALKALAPTQSEPPFQIAQLAALLLFAALTIRATMKFHVAPTGGADFSLQRGL
jgi:hypothetical protein